MANISHCLWFDHEAEEAAKFYVSVFKNGRVGRISHYGKEGFEIHGRRAGSVLTVEFEILGQTYLALNGGPQPHFKFNEAFSIIVRCDTQQEIDYYWEKLSADPVAEQCGWLKDKFGVSWQIVPSIVGDMLVDPDTRKTERVMKFIMQTKKFNIEGLKKAYEG